MSEPDVRAALEAAYLRLRSSLAAKDVSAETSRSAALDALMQALVQMEVQPDPVWLSGELERLGTKHSVSKDKDETEPAE